MNTTPELRVGVLAYPGCFASEVFGVLDLFTMATHVAHAHHQAPAFRTLVISPRRRVTASGGVLLGVQPLQPVDVLIVPGFEFVPGTQDGNSRCAGPSAAQHVPGDHETAGLGAHRWRGRRPRIGVEWDVGTVHAA